jgi:hypothetical protein
LCAANATTKGRFVTDRSCTIAAVVGRRVLAKR